ncbi:hypothetical protein ACFWN1_06090 [Streptomyces sp. NPDC058459]|uniref:hypothetical protein n=1 Tax=Streptomyces sp. NPDC058459 TaxID=3346508 RepID=UPI00364A6A8B
MRVLHEIEGVTQELARVSERPGIDSGTPVLACIAVTPEGDAEAYAGRLREALRAVLSLAVQADFDQEEVPVDGIPDWFLGAGRTLGAWEIQDWLFRFDPEMEARGWEFWDLTRAEDGSGLLHLWLDTRGEPMFSREELRWLLHACGAEAIADPMVVGADSWAAEMTI